MWQELEGEYEGSVPEGKFFSAANHVRAYIKGFADKQRTIMERSHGSRASTLHSKESTNDLSLASK